LADRPAPTVVGDLTDDELRAWGSKFGYEYDPKHKAALQLVAPQVLQIPLGTAIGKLHELSASQGGQMVIKALQKQTPQVIMTACPFCSKFHLVPL